MSSESLNTSLRGRRGAARSAERCPLPAARRHFSPTGPKGGRLVPHSFTAFQRAFHLKASPTVSVIGLQTTDHIPQSLSIHELKQLLSCAGSSCGTPYTTLHTALCAAGPGPKSLQTGFSCFVSTNTWTVKCLYCLVPLSVLLTYQVYGPHSHIVFIDGDKQRWWWA